MVNGFDSASFAVFTVHCSLFRPMTSLSQSSVPLWRDVRVLRIVGQIVFVLIIALLGWWFQQNMARGLERFHNTLSFEFLKSNASFALAESPIPYTPDDPYWYAFSVG